MEMLKKSHFIDRLPSYSSYFVERIFDIITIGLFIVFSIFLKIQPKFAHQSISALIFLISLGIILIIGIKYLYSKEFFKNHFLYINSYIKSPRILLTTLSLSLLGWILVAFGWQISLQSIGIIISLEDILFIVAFITFICNISLIPGSFGISEYSIYTILMNYGINTELAQSGAIILRGFWALNLIIGVLFITFTKFFFVIMKYLDR